MNDREVLFGFNMQSLLKFTLFKVIVRLICVITKAYKEPIDTDAPSYLSLLSYHQLKKK